MSKPTKSELLTTRNELAAEQGLKSVKATSRTVKALTAEIEEFTLKAAAARMAGCSVENVEIIPLPEITPVQDNRCPDCKFYVLRDGERCSCKGPTVDDEERQEDRAEADKAEDEDLCSEPACENVECALETLSVEELQVKLDAAKDQVGKIKAAIKAAKKPATPRKSTQSKGRTEKIAEAVALLTDRDLAILKAVSQRPNEETKQTHDLICWKIAKVHNVTRLVVLTSFGMEVAIEALSLSKSEVGKGYKANLKIAKGAPAKAEVEAAVEEAAEAEPTLADDEVQEKARYIDGLPAALVEQKASELTVEAQETRLQSMFKNLQ